MKRGRDDTLEDDDNPPTAPNRTTFRFSPDTTCSKTNVSSLPNATTNTNNNNKEQDRFLPIANVGRIMKKVIPGNGKISKDAKETVQECVSEFISFVTGEASDKCQREKRKTINGDDILWAIMTLGFEDYVNPLKIYLAKYREMEGEKLNVPKQQQRMEQCLPHEQTAVTPYNNIYPRANLIGQPPFLAAEPPPLSLPYPKSSMPAAGLPQADHHVDEHW